MKNIFRSLIGTTFALTLVLGFSKAASAFSFVNVITFGGGSGITVSDGHPGTAQGVIVHSHTHNINDDLEGNLITDVILSNVFLLIEYTGIEGSTTSELWTVAGVGDLTNNATSTNFSLFPVPLSLATTGFFTVSLSEDTRGADSFTLIRSTLSGECHYQDGSSCQRINGDPGNGGTDPGNGTPAIPEPMTLALVGSGLGISALLRRRKK